MLGGELGAEAEEHGAGSGVEAAPDPAAHQQAPGAVQAGDQHEQVAQADRRVAPVDQVFLVTTAKSGPGIKTRTTANAGNSAYFDHDMLGTLSAPRG